MKHIKDILGDNYSTLAEYDCSMDADTFSDMMEEVEFIVDEVIAELRKG